MTRGRAGRARSLWNGRVLGHVVSVVALAATAWWAVRQPAPRFPTASGDLGLLAVAVVIYGLATVARGWRWHLILARAGIAHRRADALSLTAVGYMGNTVLPARGGELLRIVLLSKRSSARRLEILGSIVAERLLDVVALVALFAALTWAGVAGAPAGQAPALIALAGAAVGAAAAVACFRARRRPWLRRWRRVARPVGRASRLLVGGRGLALAVLSVAVWLAEGVILVLVGRSLSIPLEIWDGAFLIVLASLAALIPAAPGYLGTYDAAILFGLAALDVASGPALAFAVLVRFILFVPVTLVGAALMIVRHSGWRRGESRLAGPPIGASSESIARGERS